MTGQEGYEIIREVISTGYLVSPELTVIIDISAVVRCPDGSLLSIDHQIVGRLASLEETDAKILLMARELYERKSQDISN